MNFNNDSDSEDTYNIFNKKIDLKKNEQETIKIDITSKNSTTNDKILNAQKLLDNQKDKLTSNTNNFGANSNIGFLNSNFSLGKSSLLNSLSLNKETEQIPLNKVDNEEFSMKKGNMKNVNENFKQRLMGTNKDNKVFEKNDDKDIKEINSIEIKNEFNSKKIVEEQKDKVTDNTPKIIVEDTSNKIVETDSNVINKQKPKDENDPKNKLFNMIMGKEDIDNKHMKYFLYTPLPKKTVFRCNIVRKKDGLDKVTPKYYVYTYPNQRFLMAAKKRANNTSSNYMITMSYDVFEKDENFLGKLRSNFFGTEFILYDTGVNPKDSDNSQDWRCQYAGVEYETNFFGLKGPKKMKTYLAGLTETETTFELKPSKKDPSIIELGQKKTNKRIITFVNKQPKWNEKYQAYVLDFDGRVEKGSTKNFQMCDPNNEEFVYLQFGRISETEFSMDFKFPFSPLQAFGICLSSLDSKFACE